MEKEDFNVEIVVEDFVKEITPSGNSAHIAVSKEFVGEKARIIIKRKLRICRGCHETFTNPKNFSPDKKYCTFCYEGLKKLEQLKKQNKLNCKVCKKKITEEEYRAAWDTPICEKCWIKEAEAEEAKQDHDPNYMD